MTFTIPRNKALSMEWNKELGYYAGTIKFKGRKFSVIASLDDPETKDGCILEHVSVAMKDRYPTWQDMCFFKAMFWDAEDEVYQIFPPRTSYVNLHPFCLHMWRRSDGKTIDNWGGERDT